MSTCYRCGGETHSAGALISAIRTAFRPQDSKFLTLETGDVMTRATMCRGCGLVEITGDVNKLRRLTGDPEPGTEKFLKKPGPTGLVPKDVVPKDKAIS